MTVQVAPSLWKFYSAMVYSILGRQVPLSNPPVVVYGEILLLYICLCKIFWSHIHECQEQLCARKTWPVLQATQGILCFVCVQLPSSGACPLRALYHSVPCNFLWWGIAHTYAQGVKGQITLDTTSHNRLVYPFVYWQAECTCHFFIECNPEAAGVFIDIVQKGEPQTWLHIKVLGSGCCTWADVCMWVMLFKCAWGITPPTTGVSQWSDCEVQVWLWCVQICTFICSPLLRSSSDLSFTMTDVWYVARLSAL